MATTAYSTRPATVMRMAVMNAQGDVIDRQRRPLATRQELSLCATKNELHAAVVELRARIANYHPEELSEVWAYLADLEARLSETDIALASEPDLVAVFDHSLDANSTI